MNSQSDVQGWLRDLSEVNGINLTLDDQGVCGFTVGDRLRVTIEVPAPGDVVYFYADMETHVATDAERLALYENALGMNLFGKETRGGSLARDPKDDSLLLCCSHHVSQLDSASFAQTLGDFVGTASHCRARLRPADASAVTRAQDAAEPLEADMLSIFARRV